MANYCCNNDYCGRGIQSETRYKSQKRKPQSKFQKHDENQDSNKRINHMPTIGWFSFNCSCYSHNCIGTKDFPIMFWSSKKAY